MLFRSVVSPHNKYLCFLIEYGYYSVFSGFRKGWRRCEKIFGGFRKQLELKKFKLFFLCIMHKEEGEENDKPRVVQSKQKEIM